MITEVSFDKLKSIFLQLAWETGYEKDFGEDPAWIENYHIEIRNRGKDRKKQEPYREYDGRKGYRIYDSGIFNLMNGLSMDECVMHFSLSTHKTDIIALTPSAHGVAQALAKAVDAEFPELKINVTLR